MRARNIKPKFFKNPDLADAGPIAQLLFAGLWCMADKEGRLKDQPRVIKAEVFPYYDADVNGELTVIERLGLIRRYVTSGIAVLEVMNFKKHQSPHHTEKPSDLPAYVAEKPKKPTPRVIHGEAPVNPPLDDGGNPSDSLIPDSLIPDSLIPDSLIPDSQIPDSQIPDSVVPSERTEDVPREAFGRIRASYPPGLYREADWLLAEREIRTRVLDDRVPLAELVGAAHAYGQQQQAIGRVGSQYVLKPSGFFGSTGEWRGPFPLPAQAETAMDRLMRMTSAPTDDRTIDHVPEFSRFIANS